MGLLDIGGRNNNRDGTFDDGDLIADVADLVLEQIIGNRNGCNFRLLDKDDRRVYGGGLRPTFKLMVGIRIF